MVSSVASKGLEVKGQAASQCRPVVTGSITGPGPIVIGRNACILTCGGPRQSGGRHAGLSIAGSAPNAGAQASAAGPVDNPNPAILPHDSHGAYELYCTGTAAGGGTGYTPIAITDTATTGAGIANRSTA